MIFKFSPVFAWILAGDRVDYMERIIPFHQRNDMFTACLEYTLLSLRFNPNDTYIGLIFWSIVNSAIRLGIIYLIIRVVMTALNHGSF